MKKANSKKMLKKDEHLISIIYRPLTKRIASVLLKLGVTPNPVSHSIIITALIGGIFFSFGDYKSLVMGAIFSQLSLICDLLDGMIARARNAKTMFGRWYERITNKVMKYFLVLGASIGAYKTSGDPTILIIGAIAIFNITIISFISNMRLLFNFSKDYNELPRTKRFFIPFGNLLEE